VVVMMEASLLLSLLSLLSLLLLLIGINVRIHTTINSNNVTVNTLDAINVDLFMTTSDVLLSRTSLTVLIASAAVIGVGLVVRHKVRGVGANGFGRSTVPRDVLAAAHRSSLSGSNMLVTGARLGGIGFETALAFAEAGAHVWVHTRDLDTSTRTVAELRVRSKRPIDVSPIACDLADLDDVRAMTARLLALDRPIDAVVCSAAVIFSATRQLTKQGFELYMGVNHLAHALIALRLRPLLSRAAKTAPSDVGARVVFVSSDIHASASTRTVLDPNLSIANYSWAEAYADSKLANVLFAQRFDRLFGDSGLHAFSLHPGVMRTNFYDRMEADSAISTKVVVQLLHLLRRIAGKSLEEGAATSVYCAVTPGIPGGAYYENAHLSRSTSGVIAQEAVIDTFWATTERLLAPYMADVTDVEVK
jgi:NAD(P)-dependent dehydrogenase (short-subunit alcohol dehydrogenase family)